MGQQVPPHTIIGVWPPGFGKLLIKIDRYAGAATTSIDGTAGITSGVDGTTTTIRTGRETFMRTSADTHASLAGSKPRNGAGGSRAIPNGSTARTRGSEGGRSLTVCQLRQNSWRQGRLLHKVAILLLFVQQ